jgi:hypothetical protein
LLRSLGVIEGEGWPSLYEQYSRAVTRPRRRREMMEMLDLTRAVGDRDMPILFRM